MKLEDLKEFEVTLDPNLTCSVVILSFCRQRKGLWDNIHEILDEINTNKKFHLKKVYMEDHRPLAKHLGVDSLPTLIFFKEGIRLVQIHNENDEPLLENGKLEGLKSSEIIHEVIEKVLTTPVPTGDETATEEPLSEEDQLRNSLQDNLLDDQGYIKLSELTILASGSELEHEILVEFLQAEEYRFPYTDIDGFFTFYDLLLSLMPLYDFIDIFLIESRFNLDMFFEDFQEQAPNLDQSMLEEHPYRFDICVFLLTTYCNGQRLLEFLDSMDEIESCLANSYYETENAISNDTLIYIENQLQEALQGSDQELYNIAVSIINQSGAYFQHLRRSLVNTFRINEFITLKLVGGRTNIYVKDQLFNQCKYLLLNLDYGKTYREIRSIDEAAEIVSSGSDAPGTVLSLCSIEFLKLYREADMVISKGQGNFEALSEERRSIFFLFMAKCHVVARDVGCNRGDIILYDNSRRIT